MELIKLQAVVRIAQVHVLLAQIQILVIAAQKVSSSLKELAETTVLKDICLLLTENVLNVKLIVLCATLQIQVNASNARMDSSLLITNA